MGAGDAMGAGDEFLCVVVKLTQLRPIQSAKAFEDAAIQDYVPAVCSHSPWISRVTEIGLRFLTAGNSSDCPCALVLGKVASEAD
jgi:hypothetical protein